MAFDRYSTNGYVRVAVNGIERKLRAHITPQRIQTATRTWDRNGKRVSAYFPGMRTFTLLAYAQDGKPETVFAEAS